MARSNNIAAVGFEVYLRCQSLWIDSVYDFRLIDSKACLSVRKLNQKHKFV